MGLNADYNLVTLAELKDFLTGGEDSYPVSVAMEPSLELTIDGVSRWIHEYTGRQIKSKEITEYYDGDGTQQLYLNSWPTTIATADIRIDSSYAFGADTEITPEIIDGPMVYYSGGFPSGVRNIKAVYTAGYTTIPSDIKLACLQMCQIADRAQKKGVSGLAQISIAGASFQLHVEKLAPPYVLDVLNRYKRGF